MLAFGVCVTTDGRLHWRPKPKSNPERHAVMIELRGGRPTDDLLAGRRAWLAHRTTDPVAIAIRELRAWYRHRTTRAALVGSEERDVIVLWQGCYHAISAGCAYQDAQQRHAQNSAVCCGSFAGFGSTAVLLPWAEADVVLAGNCFVAERLMEMRKADKARTHYALEREAGRILKRTLLVIHAQEELKGGER